jgi:hypothetical protein
LTWATDPVAALRALAAHLQILPVKDTPQRAAD